MTLERAPDDEWQRKATAAAIEAARNVVAGDAINGRAMVGSLSEIEWSWIVSAAIFGWIKVKAQQATYEGINSEITIRSIRGEPAAWEAGAVQDILPALADIEVDWTKPVGDWSKEDMIKLAWSAHKLVDAALAARDDGATRDGIIVNHPHVAARQINGDVGNPLLSPDELNDPIPF